MRISQCSLVVPVYNGPLTLPDLLDRLGSVLTTISDQFEVILVNDGSRDHSWDVTWELAGEHNSVRGINLMPNYGQHNAVLCGTGAACLDVIVTANDCPQ